MPDVRDELAEMLATLPHVRHRCDLERGTESLRERCRAAAGRRGSAASAGQDRVTAIPLPWVRPPLTGNDRGHTRYSPFVRVKGEALVAIRAARVEPRATAGVTLHWLIPDRRRRDADNLAPTLKACGDALVAAGVLPDDGWQHVPIAACRIHPPDGTPARMWLELT